MEAPINTWRFHGKAAEVSMKPHRSAAGVPWESPWGYHRSPIEAPIRWRHHIVKEVPWTSHGSSTGVLCLTGVSCIMGLPWDSHGTCMALRYSHGISRDQTLRCRRAFVDPYGTSMVIPLDLVPWTFHRTSMELSWDFNVASIGLSWCFHSMGLYHPDKPSMDLSWDHHESFRGTPMGLP